MTVGSTERPTGSYAESSQRFRSLVVALMVTGTTVGTLFIHSQGAKDKFTGIAGAATTLVMFLQKKDSYIEYSDGLARIQFKPDRDQGAAMKLLQEQLAIRR